MNSNNITGLFNIRYPFLQGGMARIATGDFAAAVSNAGGLGTIGSGSMEPHMLVDHIERCQSLTDKPFAVNLMLLNPHCDELVDIIIDHEVPIVTTGAGSPGAYLDRFHEAGIKVVPVVSSPAMAVRMEGMGVDGIIAEGTEAGGHVGELTTMVLTLACAKAVDIPVIAAGGIATSEQVAASFCLGAQGVQCGTVLLGAEECPIHENFRDKILKAKATDSTVIGRIGGLPTRVLKNKMSREYIKEEKAGKSLEDLERTTLGGLARAVVDGDVTTGSLMAGQVVGFVDDIRPLADILADLFDGAQAAFAEGEKRYGYEKPSNRQ